MKNITGIFKDDLDRIITIAMLVLTFFLLFIPSLIVVFIPKTYISESTYNIAKSLFNFELLLFLICLPCVIPFIGWLAGLIIIPVVFIWNIIVVVINLCSIAKENTAKIPEFYKFI